MTLALAQLYIKRTADKLCKERDTDGNGVLLPVLSIAEVLRVLPSNYSPADASFCSCPHLELHQRLKQQCLTLLAVLSDCHDAISSPRENDCNNWNAVNL